jgi:hypothetical protein
MQVIRVGLLILVGTGVFVWGVVNGVQRVKAQQCFAEAQVFQSCALYNQCLYLFNGVVYEKDTCSTKHQGHACGSKFTSIPSLHNTLLNTVFPSLKRGTAYETAPVIGSSDVTGDGRVNIFDVGRVLGRFGRRGDCGFESVDVLADGGVDFRDFQAVVLAVR